ncbi:hypothetical protein KC363_g52 [Hortaea werneckii]|nr:hypothetical protein KC363_g52 [Hortaea werneckii]
MISLPRNQWMGVKKRGQSAAVTALFGLASANRGLDCRRSESQLLQHFGLPFTPPAPEPQLPYLTPLDLFTCSDSAWCKVTPVDQQHLLRDVC